MKTYDASNIRNVLLVGHGGAGKTSLLEAMLFTSGAITRMGTIEDGNTVSDHDPEETRKETARVIKGLEQELANLSESVARLRVLKDEASEHGEVAAKLAFLVSRTSFTKFRRAAERLAGVHAALGGHRVP